MIFSCEFQFEHNIADIDLCYKIDGVGLFVVETSKIIVEIETATSLLILLLILALHFLDM